jgi:hypothetical protein
LEGGRATDAWWLGWRNAWLGLPFWLQQVLGIPLVALVLAALLFLGAKSVFWAAEVFRPRHH